MKTNIMKIARFKILICFLVLSMLSVGVSVTYAYLQHQTKVENAFETKSIGVGIYEVFDQNQPLLPGETINKKVKFTNPKDTDILIRVKYEEGWYDKITGKKNELLLPSMMGKIWTKSWYSYGASGEDWLNLDDGYYYYRYVLKSNESTKDILESLKLSPLASNDEHASDYSNHNYKLTFTVEACRANVKVAKYLFGHKLDILSNGKVVWEKD